MSIDRPAALLRASALFLHTASPTACRSLFADVDRIRLALDCQDVYNATLLGQVPHADAKRVYFPYLPVRQQDRIVCAFI